MKPGKAIASFDSASAFLRVLARHLHGKDSPALGLGPAGRITGRVSTVVNHLPSALRETIYARAGQFEATTPGRLGRIDVEEVAEWVIGHYPRRRYPAVLIGSSSGAVTHLAALAGVPWLPQTLLVPVRHGGLDPDRPRAAMEALAGARTDFTGPNPQIGLHHMHDANQDRLMIRRMAYFRFKYRSLPRAYAAFLRDCLEPAGTVLVTDCGERWPTSDVGPRQVFQHGAVGGATAEQYAHGGPQVAQFLAEQGSAWRAWDAPPPDGASPEAEWGFDDALLPGLARLCDAEGWSLERLNFPHPDALSAPVAELYRTWFRANGMPANRLLVDCFALLDPHLPLRLGLAPYWTVFPIRDARDTLLRYLQRTEPYDDIHLGLFSHGTCSIGRATIEDWQKVLGQARRRGIFCGVDPSAHPQDFASNVRFHDELSTLDPTTPGPPGTPPWPWVRAWLRQHADADLGYLTGDAAT
ncbi:hypothetical protein [Amycolatopsis anabasis]|uniref:hypothetical protein n=1 Tax=Amycolatopsis anabasis TaxID=1840409 RepID=UPI00131E4665|nr:hypothetical protein [Amycolatopsis anabasis]